MGLLDWLFGKKKEEEKVEAPTSSEERITVPISSVKPDAIPEDATVVEESQIPVSCNLGNLNFEKEYQKAIDEGLTLLKKNPKDCGVHINLMVSYFKAREEDPTYLDKCTYHAKQAIIWGHNTGYAQDRLMKNLTKAKLFHQAIQLCDIVLRDDFHFCNHSMGNKEDYEAKKAKLIPKLLKALDSDSYLLFTPGEVAQIIQSIKDNDERNRFEKIAYKKKMKQLEEDIAKENEKLRNFFKEYRKDNPY